jgi:hypothetical protein
MPTIEVKKPLATIKEIQVIPECSFPPVTVDAEGTVRYGTIKHIEFKGNDEDGNPSGNVYFYHDELPDELKVDLVTVLLKHLPTLASSIGATVDLTPTPFIPPVVEEVAPVVEEVADGEGEG